MTSSYRTYSNAARWTTASSIARGGMQLAQIVILARFLTPLEYGLMSIVVVVLSYFSLFSDMGLSTAFVQRQRISQEERSSLYWLSVLLGGGLMLIVLLISPFIAKFFNEPQLVSLLTLVSTNFLIIAIGQQLRIDAEKALYFRPVALIEIFASLCGFTASVLTAWLGWGIYALVTAAIVSAWVNMIMYWTFLARGWRPTLRLNWDEVRWFVRFGGSMVLNNAINHVNSSIDVLLGGRLLGATQLGLYAIPRNLTLQIQFLINPIFTRVGFPAIASMQHDKERVKNIFLKTLNLTASINAPIYTVAFVFAPEIVFLLLGEKWQEATPLLRVLAIWGLLRSFGNPVGSLLFGLGKVKISTYWNGGVLILTPPVVWLGSQFGAIGIAFAMSCLSGALFFPTWKILIRPICGTEFGEYLQQVTMPVICAIFAGGVAWLITLKIIGTNGKLGVGLFFCALIYLIMTKLFNRDFYMLIVRTIRFSNH